MIRSIGHFLCSLMRRMGFSKEWVNLIYYHGSSNWYSLIVNGQRFGFFKSKNGLWQGDQISPSLFVLSAELFSVMLNDLQSKRRYMGFYLSRQGPWVNHLAFADDIILFTSGRRKTLKLVIDTLAKYERVSGQKINKSKSFFMLEQGASLNAISRGINITGMHFKQFPIKYLGFPLFARRQKISYFSELINKVTSKVRGWQTKLLSTGERQFLSNMCFKKCPYIYWLLWIHQKGSSHIEKEFCLTFLEGLKWKRETPLDIMEINVTTRIFHR